MLFITTPFLAQTDANITALYPQKERPERRFSQVNRMLLWSCSVCIAKNTDDRLSLHYSSHRTTGSLASTASHRECSSGSANEVGGHSDVLPSPAVPGYPGSQRWGWWRLGDVWDIRQDPLCSYSLPVQLLTSAKRSVCNLIVSSYSSHGWQSFPASLLLRNHRLPLPLPDNNGRLHSDDPSHELNMMRSRMVVSPCSYFPSYPSCIDANISRSLQVLMAVVVRSHGIANITSLSRHESRTVDCHFSPLPVRPLTISSQLNPSFSQSLQYSHGFLQK